MDIGSKKGGCWESRHAWVGAPSHYEVCTPVISSALPFFSLFPTLNLSMRQHPQGMKSPPPPRQAYATSLYQTFIFCVLRPRFHFRSFWKKKDFFNSFFLEWFSFPFCLSELWRPPTHTHAPAPREPTRNLPKVCGQFGIGPNSPLTSFCLTMPSVESKKEQKIQRRKGLNKVK